jgi:ABC-type sugar transport system permease subunit
LIFVAGSVVLQLAIGFALAWLIDAGRRRRCRARSRADGGGQRVGDSWRSSPEVSWKILLIENRSGIVNYCLSQAGVGRCR